MDHFEGVVLDYLRADRALFVNNQCCIQINSGSNPDTSGPHWYCDAVAVSFREQVVYLCEITFATTSSSLLTRLRAWNDHWEAIKTALCRDSNLPEAWPVRPWLFVPEAQVVRLRSNLAGMKALPNPRITALEEVVPWRYRSWDRGAYSELDERRAKSPIGLA